MMNRFLAAKVALYVNILLPILSKKVADQKIRRCSEMHEMATNKKLPTTKKDMKQEK